MISNAKSKSITSLYILLGIVLVLCLLSQGVNAELGTFKQKSCINIRVLNNCSTNTLIEVNTLNKTYVINRTMTKLGGQTFNYTFCNTTDVGEYSYSWSPSCYDCALYNCGNSFIVNESGLSNISGIVIIFFIVIFLILLGLTAYLSLYTLGHFVAKDFDLIDLSLNFAIYFIIVGVLYFQKFYFGSPFMDNYFTLIVSVGGVMFMLVPIIAFIWSVSYQLFTQKKLKLEAPRKMRFRR